MSSGTADPKPSSSHPLPSACFTFGSSDDSGAGRMGFYFAKEFRRRGWNVTAMCPPPPPGQGSVVTRLEDVGVAVEIFGQVSGRPDTGIVRTLKRHLVRTGARVVVSMHQQDMKFAACAGMLASVPYVASGQNTFTFSGGAARRWVAARTLQALLRWHCSGVIATSQRVADEFRGLLGYRGPLEIQPNGVDTGLFAGARAAREKVRSTLAATPVDRVVVSVGRITRQKNQLGLVEAFARAFPADAPHSGSTHLWMVGAPAQTAEDQEYFRQVEGRISGLGLGGRARVTGWRKDIPDILAAADLYVQASLWEGSPLAVLEAMAAGLPVIVADNGGVLPDFQPGTHGWIIPAGNTEALASVLQEALKVGHAALDARGQAARELVTRRYDSAAVAGRFFELATAHAGCR